MEAEPRKEEDQQAEQESNAIEAEANSNSMQENPSHALEEEKVRVEYIPGIIKEALERCILYLINPNIVRCIDYNHSN